MTHLLIQEDADRVCTCTENNEKACDKRQGGGYFRALRKKQQFHTTQEEQRSHPRPRHDREKEWTPGLRGRQEEVLAVAILAQEQYLLKQRNLLESTAVRVLPC